MPIDMSAASTVKAPPRKNAPRKAAVSSVDPTADREALRSKREDGLNGLGQLAQGGCLIMKQYADAAAIGTHAPNVAHELATLADSYDVIAKPIDFLIQVGPFGALIVAALPLVLQIAANHRLIDASAMAGQGVVPPEVLDAQMRANVARMQADAMKEQQRAIEDANRAEREYAEMMRENSQSVPQDLAA